MSQLEIKQALKAYGLENDEIKVYLAVLAMGEATVREIAEDTRIKRTTIYLIAERLIEKGIMGEYKAKYGTHYTVSSPSFLLSRLDGMKLEIEKVMPELKALEKKENFEPSTKLYRGKSGYLKILEETLDGYSHEALYIGSAEDLNEVISEKYSNKYIEERVKRKIRFRQIVFPDSYSRKLKEKDEKELRRTRFLPKDHKFSANLVIFKDKVAYLSSKRELIGVVIESQEISQMEKEKFEMMWNKIPLNPPFSKGEI
jgi:HTH-type transcriptional regulator, sugar sensing transcriptional regulator